MDTNKVTRLEIIDWRPEKGKEPRGRVYSIRSEDIKLELSLQDESRTLKVFITER